MDSNYYDDERMNNEMDEAMNSDLYEKSNYIFDDNFDLDGELDDLQISELKNQFTELKIEDFRDLPKGWTCEKVKYKGWSRFFGKYVSLHFILVDKYYTFCVIRINELKSNFNYLQKDDWIDITYSGIRKNSKGEDYPILSFKFRLFDS